MTIDIDAVVKAIRLVAPVPAIARAIYDQAKPLFEGTDQAALQAAYDVAWSDARRDHADFQQEMKG